MHDPAGLLRLLAETEAMLARESENILAGRTPDAGLAAGKADMIRRLVRHIAPAADLAPTVSALLREQLRTGTERLLQAATRNEAVLRGALRGGRILLHAACDTPESYPGRQSSTPPAAALPGRPGSFDRRA